MEHKAINFLRNTLYYKMENLIMSTISVRFSEKEDTLIRKYAELNGMNLSSFIRDAVLERIEDEYDAEIADKVWKEEKDKPRISHEEIKKMYGL